MEYVKIKDLIKNKLVLKRFDKSSWKSPKFIGGSLVLLLLLAGGGYYLNSSSTAAYVIVNGETVGIVKSVQNGKSLIQKVLEKKGTLVGSTAKTHDQIEYSSARVNEEYKELTEEELSQKLTPYIEGVELKVEGKPLFILPNQEAADSLLKAYQEMYAKVDESNQVTSISFEEEVTTEGVEAPLEKVVSLQQALEKLKLGNVTREEYEIQKDDSWWLIARKNDLLTNEVLAANPGTTLDSVIKPGEKIFIERVSPYLTVVSEGIQIEKETIPFDVVTKSDATLDSGKTKVTQSGSDGEKEIKYSYVKKNDKIISKNVLDEKVLKKAVDQVVAKGAQRTQVAVASSRGSGQSSGFIVPYNGRINSYYGYRGGEFHTGIDYGGSVGNPYVAAGSGTVVSAGWNGNYGYSIVINHGNGIQTRYAHSSKLLVTAGQTVSKGQTIGLIGSTGRSSGPHLHFEVIVNGDHVNPMSYLR
jgi:murein DD-endopeptidase MepM/ murein hydrolase activator NlpD